MARVKRAVHGRKHHRAVLEQAKGYYGNKSRSYRAANEQLMHSMQYAFRDRRARKGDFRKLWIQRINAGARQHGMSYSRLINGLHLAGVEVDRKVLADLAVSDPEAFGALVATAQDALAQRARGRGRFLTQRLAFTHRRVRRLRGLLQKRSARWSERAFVAEGAELIRCALDAGVPVESVYVSPDGADDRAVQEVCRRAEAGGRAGLPPGRRRPGAGGRHRHAAAGAGRAAHARGAAGRDRRRGRPATGALVVVLVDVRDPGNAGTVLRAADAAGSTAVVFAGDSVDPYNPKTVRASAGSLFHVPAGRAARPARRWPPSSPAPGFRTLATVVRDGEDYAGLDWSVPDGAVPGQRVLGARPRAGRRALGRRWPSRWRGGPSRSTSAWPAPWSASRRSANAGAAVPRHVASRTADGATGDWHD